MGTEVSYENQTVIVQDNETVLEAFERSGISIPSSCRVGVCHFCLLKATHGDIPKQAQEGLDAKLKAAGHFKACVCKVKAPLVCVPAHSTAFQGQVHIKEILPIGPSIVRVRFQRPDGFTFVPGQFVTFQLDKDLARSYSLASAYADHIPFFDIHVRRVANGRMSTWFHDQARPKDTLWMSGPKGECVYRPENPEYHLALIGTGTGMAPLHALLCDAMEQGHSGPITILHGARTIQDFYLVEEFEKLRTRYSQIQYHRIVIQGPAAREVSIGDLRNLASEHIPTRKDQHIYLCGDPGLVRHLKKQFFLCGTSLKNIHADPFVGTNF